MVIKNGISSSRSGNNGGSEYFSTCSLMWKYRFHLMKGFILFFFISNLFYFAVRYVELTNTVRKLETEKSKKCPVQIETRESDKKKEINDKEVKEKAKSDDDGPQLNYSQKKYYPYIFNEPNICSDENLKPLPVFLLIVVKSTTAQFDRRRSIRMTWGNEDNIEGIIIKRIFLVAKGDDDKKQLLLGEESEEYHDIIQGDFHDSFRNLTIKDIMFMRWMTTYCSHVKFIFKGDDDVFVNIHNIIDFLISLPPEKAKDLFAGSVLYPSPRITDPKSKYYVSTNLWNEKYYPPYVSGGGFLMSSLVTKKIYEVTKVTPIIPIDDAFLGVCLKKLGMKPQNHKGFKSWGVNRKKDLCIYKEIMTLHKLNSEEMVEMWRKLEDSSFDASDCATAFKVVPNNDTKAEVVKTDAHR